MRDIMKAIVKNYLGVTLSTWQNQILVADPDYAQRGKLVSTLAREGFPVLEGVDAEDGFQQALLQVPSLVITARNMPYSPTSNQRLIHAGAWSSCFRRDGVRRKRRRHSKGGFSTTFRCLSGISS
jgi:hypothetical protein